MPENPVGTKEDRQRFRELFLQSGFALSCDESLLALDGLDIAERHMEACRRGHFVEAEVTWRDWQDWKQGMTPAEEER